jgi:pimeloyl-ACP methyl ester carboxylesterase
MTIGFDRIGAGPQMVLLHPLGADRRVWDAVAHRLSDHREVITVDLPGFGESTPLDGDCDPAALAAAVARWLADEGIEQPHVVGNSLGGWVALELALAGAARAVTTFGAAGLWPRPLLPKPSVARRMARAGRPLIGATTLSAAGRRLLLTGIVAHAERVPAADAARLIRSYATAPGFPRVNAAMRAGRFTGLAEITVPVTLVWGEHDRMVMPPRSIPPRVESLVLRDVGHIPELEAPGAVAELLMSLRDPALAAEYDPA